MKQISRKIIVVPRIWNEKHKAYLDDNSYSGKLFEMFKIFKKIRVENKKTILSFFLWIIIIANQMAIWILNKCLGQDLDM